MRRRARQKQMHAVGHVSLSTLKARAEEFATVQEGWLVALLFHSLGSKHVTRRVGQFVHSTDHALKPRHIVLQDTLRELECIYLRLYRLTLCLSALITHAGFPCSEALAVCNEVQDVR